MLYRRDTSAAVQFQVSSTESLRLDDDKTSIVRPSLGFYSSIFELQYHYSPVPLDLNVNNDRQFPRVEKAPRGK